VKMARRHWATLSAERTCVDAVGAGAAGTGSKKGKWQVRGPAAWRNATAAAFGDDLVGYDEEALVLL
jgi:hypothetical protein